MAIGASKLQHRSVENIENTLFEILALGLQQKLPEHPMLILDDLFQARLKEKLRRVEEKIMSRVPLRDPTRLEPPRWEAVVDPSAYFKNCEILLLNTPNRHTNMPSKTFSAVFTKKQMNELVNNRKGRVIWYAVSVYTKKKIA